MTLLDDARAGDLTVFRCRITTRNRGGFVGVARGNELVTDDEDEALAAVIAAWGYGVKRTVSAIEVARVAGFLEGVREAARPVLTQADIDEIGNAEWRQQVALPREITVDGNPGVEYWNRSGQPPLWRSQLVVGKDGAPEITVKPIGQFLAH